MAATWRDIQLQITSMSSKLMARATDVIRVSGPSAKEEKIAFPMNHIIQTDVDNVKGYRIYDPVKNKVTTSRDVIIQEKPKPQETVTVSLESTDSVGELVEESVVKLEPLNKSSSSESDYLDVDEELDLFRVDTTAQYDAVRAYLKELDISSAVWVGLIRSNPDGDFTWTDYRGLSGDGYWSAAPDARSAPLCAAADPAADYRWEARACGGPSVASFICELPVPQWALGNEGCMVRALPALTVLYLPESAAVQLTADCGLAGVKRVQCTGNVKREDLLKELSCTEEEQTTASPIITTPLISWQTATDTTFSDQDTSNEVNTEENITTEHEDDINQSTSIKLLSTIQNSLLSTTEQLVMTQPPIINKLYKVPLEKNINLDIVHNNLLYDNQKLPNNDDLFTNAQTKKLEEEKNLQHQKLHVELARLGNLETIFSQPTDHFVPPLVMAKAKISDDMTALSIEEKLAQQLSEHNGMQRDSENLKDLTSTEIPTKDIAAENSMNNSLFSTKTNDNQYIDYSKYLVPKKYTKYDEMKTKMSKNIKLEKNSKSSVDTTSNNPNAEEIDTTTVKSYAQNFHTSNIVRQIEEDTSLELTVIIKEPRLHDEDNFTQENNSQIIYGQNHHNLPANISPVESLVASPIEHKVVMNDEVIKIEIIKNNNKHPNIDVTVFEVTTKVPVSENKIKNNTNIDSEQSKIDTTLENNVSSSKDTTPDVSENDLITASIRSTVDNITLSDSSTQTTGATLITIVADVDTEADSNLTLNYKEKNNTEESIMLYNASISENNNEFNETDITDNMEKNMTDTTPDIDDFQSPLLSAANEPLHKPTRSRRPQSLQNRNNKFNPFRILG
ncbi:putative uncharacterized protein DDB_G0282129 [Pararge aegeria]|uniref:putative uncharacterized protein DDB_G0282129 n=1 Tax=Pararge aegeria TaxID=116150 RepID=UPI0019D0BBD5|nr:putative uncharacterized protein DDB_G0282129 [Pararge aegeria]